MSICNSCDHNSVCGMKGNYVKSKNDIKFPDNYLNEYPFVSIIAICTYYKTSNTLAYSPDYIIKGNVGNKK